MSRFERWLLNISIAVSTCTGIAYFVMRDFMRRSDPFTVLGHPWQPHVLALHLLAGPWVVFALGLIAREHILERARNSRAGRGRRSGLITIGLAVPMILSGYILQVLTSSSGRRFTGLFHLVSGAGFALLFVGHLWRAARRRGAVNGRRSAVFETPT